MKKQYFFSLILVSTLLYSTLLYSTLLYSTLLYSQIYQTWTKRYVGPYGVDEPFALKLNNQGDPVITGRSEYAAAQNNECPVIKYYSCNGNIAINIIQNYNGANLEIGRDLSIDNSNNIFLAGDTYAGALGYYFNMLYSKFNSSLSLSFINQYGNLRSQESKKIKIDSQGNFYVGGTNELAGGGFEFLLVKFNSSGTFQWARGYNNGLNTFQEHLLEDMIIDPNGYIYVTGGSEGTGTMFDITTLKYDLNGNLLWTNRYNGNGNSSDGPYSIDLDSQGNVYVGGVSVEEENPSESANPRNTFIVIKYNPANGNRSWVRYFYGNSLSSRDASCAAVKTDANNNVICTGYANMLSAYDYITIKYDPSGNIIWSKQYDFGNTRDYASAIAVDNLNNVYITGRSRATPDPDSYFDYATIKYNGTTGNQEWAARYDGTGANNDLGKFISVYGNNNVYVTGRSVGQGTDYDFLTIRYYNGWVSCDVEDFSGNNDINEVCFIDSQKVSAVTSSGSILQSSNQGLSWTEVTNTGQDGLNAIKFMNRNVGCAVGNFGKIYFTSNGGSQWQRKQFNSTGRLNDVCFKSDGSIYFCADKGMVGKFSSFTDQIILKQIDSTVTLETINFLNAQTGFIAGSSGSIFKTTDSGNSWKKIQLNSNFYFNKINYDNKNNIYLVGHNGLCLRSSNIGSTWNRINIGINTNLNDICIKDSSTVYVSGDSGKIIVSFNLGETWEKQETETYKNIQSIKFNKDIGVASGDNNLFIRTGFPESIDYSSGSNKSQNLNHEIKKNSTVELNDNYPNPFNPTTKISYYIPEESMSEIKIFDLTGRLIEILDKGYKTKGNYSVNFNGSNLSSGVYFYTLNVFEKYGSTRIHSETKKMFLIK